MLTYLLEVTLCWFIFYSIFFLALRKLTFFRVNRWFLLSSIVAGLLIPQLRHVDIDVYQEEVAQVAPIVYVIKDAPAQISHVVTEQVEKTSFDWSIVLWSFYLIGLAFFLFRFVKGLVAIRSLYNDGVKTKTHNYTLVSTLEDHLPFSFFSYVFISDQVELQDEYQHVIEHELSHVEGRHSLDVIFLEIINCIFWFNPMIYLYKTALRQTHEYLADEAVLSHTSRKKYGTLLLKQSLSGLQIALTHQFFHSHIKKRINMMYQKKSGRSAWLKYVLALPVLLLLFVVFSGHSDSVKSLGDNHSAFINSNGEVLVVNKPFMFSKVAKDLDVKFQSRYDYFMMTDQGWYVSNFSLGTRDNEIKVDELRVRPEPKSNSGLNSYRAKSSDPSCRLDKEGYAFFANDAFGLVDCGTGSVNMDCTGNKISELVESIKVYPKQAKKDGVQWRLFFELLIDKEGRPEKIRDVPNYPYPDDKYGFKLEADRIFESIKDQLKFSPSMCDGQPQKTKMTLSISFKLSDAEIEALPVKNKSTVNPETKIVIMGYSKNNISFEYHSNMNVQTKYVLKSADGSVIADGSKRYFYKKHNHYMPHKKNLAPGKYKIIADQGGYITEMPFTID